MWSVKRPSLLVNSGNIKSLRLIAVKNESINGKFSTLSGRKSESIENRKQVCWFHFYASCQYLLNNI